MAEPKEVGARVQASDIFFRDGVDLQTKLDNAALINPNAFNGVHAVSPTVEVAESTDAIFTLKIKSLNGTVITPNLKGEDANQLAVRTQDIRDAKGAVVIDLSKGETVTLELTGDISRLVFTGLNTDGRAHYITLLLKHDKAYMMSCAGNIKWPYINKNKYFRLNEGVNCVRMMTLDNGNTWYVISVTDYIDED